MKQVSILRKQVEERGNSFSSSDISTVSPLMFQKELSKMITLEQGKTLADAEGDVFRGLRK